jgi:hypothetical protein
MQRYQQNYFSWILVFKDAKSCHLFIFIFLIYVNMIFFSFLRDLDLCKIKIFKCIFERKIFFILYHV